MSKLSPKEVRERTEDVFEPVKVVFVDKGSREYQLEFLGYFVQVEFSKDVSGINGAKTVGHYLLFVKSLNIWNDYYKVSDLAIGMGRLFMYYSPLPTKGIRVVGVPLKKILRKLIRFWRAELENLEKTKKREKAGDLTS